MPLPMPPASSLAPSTSAGRAVPRAPKRWRCDARALGRDRLRTAGPARATDRPAGRRPDRTRPCVAMLRRCIVRSAAASSAPTATGPAPACALSRASSPSGRQVVRMSSQRRASRGRRVGQRARRRLVGCDDRHLQHRAHHRLAGANDGGGRRQRDARDRSKRYAWRAPLRSARVVAAARPAHVTGRTGGPPLCV